MKKQLLSLLLLLPATMLPAQDMVQQLAGNWMFMASNNGKVVNGVYSAGIDSVAFTATPSADGTCLLCHADAFYKSSTADYPADWQMVVEEDGTGNHRIGWVLDAAEPFFSKEFLEPAASYMDEGFFYWGKDDGSHRYMYLLTENADASLLVGDTFWSAWSSAPATSYSLTCAAQNSYKMTVVVATEKPFSGTVGYVEVWASPKLMFTATNAISDATGQQPATSALYDLWGRRLSQRPHSGMYIQDGHKRVAQ